MAHLRPTAPEPGRTRLKVCCVGSEEEVEVARAAGADLLGFVSAMPSGPGVLPEDRIAELVRRVPRGTTSVLLTSATAAERIAEQHRRCPTGALQLVARLPPAELRGLRDRLPPSVRLLQVIHVEGPEAVPAAEAVAADVDAILLDSGRPGASVPELGGTGRTHDWAVSARIRERVPVPVFLAGGLRPENVAEAVRTVRPFGVDVCTGVRTGGRLDPARLAAFVRALVQGRGTGEAGA